MNFVKGSTSSIITSTPKDAQGADDPFVAGDSVSYQIFDADGTTISADQGTIGTPVLSADGLSYTTPFTRPQALSTGSILRTFLKNEDGTPALVPDEVFNVIGDDVTTAVTSIT